MSEPPSPLQPRDVVLLREARDADPPGPEAKARVLARLAVVAPVLAPRGTASAASLAGKAVVAVTALVVGGVAGAGLYAELRPSPPPQLVYLPQPLMPSTASVAPVVAPSAAAELSASPPAGLAPRAIPSPAPAGAYSSHAAQLTAERVLLDEARGALAQGDPSRALDRIERHRRTFSSPILGEERDAMEVEALARLGRSAEARARADAFRRRTPDSLFLPAVESAIGSIP
jgi:hypothetical protein